MTSTFIVMDAPVPFRFRHFGPDELVDGGAAEVVSVREQVPVGIHRLGEGFVAQAGLNDLRVKVRGDQRARNGGVGADDSAMKIPTNRQMLGMGLALLGLKLIPRAAAADTAAVLAGLGNGEADAHLVEHDRRAGRDRRARIRARSGHRDGAYLADRLHAGLGVEGDGGLDIRFVAAKAAERAPSTRTAYTADGAPVEVNEMIADAGSFACHGHTSPSAACRLQTPCSGDFVSRLASR
jgi:hypothetical protein